MTSNDEKVLTQIAIIFPYKTCTEMITNNSKVRKEFEEWYKNKYGKEYEWSKEVKK